MPRHDGQAGVPVLNVEHAGDASVLGALASPVGILALVRLAREHSATGHSMTSAAAGIFVR